MPAMSRPPLFSCVLLVVWVVANPLPTAAPTLDHAWEFNITLTATDDTYVNRWPCCVDYVFGSSTSLKVKTRPFTSDIVYAAFLRFALDDGDDDAVAELAAEGYALALVRGTLRLHATRAVDDLTVYSLNNTGWSEDDLDGTTAPGHAALTAMESLSGARGARAVARASSLAGPGWISVNVSAALDAWRDAASPLAGAAYAFALESADDPDDDASFTSKEGGAAPQLVLTVSVTIPPPPTPAPTPAPSASHAPTASPSRAPTAPPTAPPTTPTPTAVPTVSPTVSLAPTMAPTLSPAPTVSLAPTAAAPHACMGNGDLVAERACACDAGWKGPSCNVLDLLPLSRAHPGWMNNTNVSAGNMTWKPSWGAGAVYEGGTWYLVAASKKYVDGEDGKQDLFGQNCHTLVLRSTSGHVGGPYELAYDLSWHFRVDLKRLGPNGTLAGGGGEQTNGTLLLMTKGYTAESETDPGRCHFEGDDRQCDGFGFKFMAAPSGSVYGPWVHYKVYDMSREDFENPNITNFNADPANDDPYRWDCEMADPSFVVLEDNTTVIAYRGTQCIWRDTDVFQEVMGLLVAPHWTGPFRRLGVKIFGEHPDAEDPYLWRSRRGVHMLMHNMNTDHGLLHKKRRGAYAFSPDGIGNWSFTETEAWENALTFDDCAGYDAMKRQRASLVFDVATGAPSHLITGVSTSQDGIRWGDGWTAIQPINTGPSAVAQACAGGGACCAGRCAEDEIGRGGGVCDPCPVDTACAAMVSNGARTSCECAACGPDHLRYVDADDVATCSAPSNFSSQTCWNTAAWALAPGTGNGDFFRCGRLEDVRGTYVYNCSFGLCAGFYGHCIPAGARCNGVENCADSSPPDEARTARDDTSL